MKLAILMVTIASMAVTGCYDTERDSSSTVNSKSTDGRTETEIIPGVSIVEEPGDFTVNMPPPLSGQTDDSGPTIEVVVRISEGDRYYIGDRSVSKEEISARLKDAATMAEGRVAENCTAAVRIIDEGASSYEAVMEVVRLAGNVGVKSIRFGPTNGDE